MEENMICTHTHSFFTGIVSHCARCGATRPPKSLGLPADLSIEDVRAFFDRLDDDDTMHMDKSRPRS